MTEQSHVVGPEGKAHEPTELAGQISSVEKLASKDFERLRAELTLEIRQVTSMLTEWRTAHEQVHVEQRRALDAAQAAMVDKLADMNEFRQQSRDREDTFAKRDAVEVGLAAIKAAIDSEKTDTRRRFETLEAKLNEMATALAKEARDQGRPGQDLKTSQGAIIATIVLAVTILGAIILVANFVSAP